MTAPVFRTSSNRGLRRRMPRGGIVIARVRQRQLRRAQAEFVAAAAMWSAACSLAEELDPLEEVDALPLAQLRCELNARGLR